MSLRKIFKDWCDCSRADTIAIDAFRWLQRNKSFVFGSVSLQWRTLFTTTPSALNCTINHCLRKCYLTNTLITDCISLLLSRIRLIRAIYLFIVTIFMTMSPFFVDNFPILSSTELGKLRGARAARAAGLGATQLLSGPALTISVKMRINTETLSEEKSMCFYFIK